ncbi:MAG: leucyl/phenylalanyl-tRNA--protein transferase [Bryobacteraceae bacterium]|nr:leucyl/phenylalanyl-tRNA--protein transferase [Bryobacteraceae bacterium]
MAGGWERSAFPNPLRAPKSGRVAIGGDLSPALLLDAYDHGIFPWYSQGEPVQWWSPDPRAVITLESLHVSKSLTALLRKNAFSITWNRDFQAVMKACGENRDDGTWITPEMIEAYVRLHELRTAHSIEVWRGGELVGGLYGVARGAAFMAESMFHRATNASKVALVSAVRGLWAAGVRLIDVQFLTPHLESMGVFEIPRQEYVRRVAALRILEIDLWSKLSSSS